MLELLRSLLLSPRRRLEYNGETPEKTGFLVGSGKLFRGHKRWMSKRQIRKKHPKVCLCPGSSIYLNCMNAHTLEHICADSVVVITRRCQRLNPGSSPGRRIHIDPFLRPALTQYLKKALNRNQGTIHRYFILQLLPKTGLIGHFLSRVFQITEIRA
jgi:hypothetical protein